MSPSPHILASSEEAIFKLAVFVIVLFVWGVGALASALKGVKKRASRRPPPLVSTPPRPRTDVRITPPRLPVAAQAALPPLSSRAAKAASRRVVAKAGPVARLLRGQQAPAVLPSSRPAPAPSRRAASAMATWMRPATIRSQFVLSEILGKPLALRDRPHLASPPSSPQEQYARLGSEA